MLSPSRADYALHIQSETAISVYLSVTAITTALSDASEESKRNAAEAAECVPESGRPAIREALVDAHRRMRDRRKASARVRSSNPLFSEWIDRSLADLGLLTTDLDTGPYLYAGIPWFSTAFGRDAIITSLQMLWLHPTLARGVLRFLATHQAKEDSAFRDAEVGKIMHETRKSEMAATGEVPFALYYGGVDSTPLFIVLAGAYAQRTGDTELIDEIWPSLQLAADWVARHCDKNPDGLLDYQRATEHGLANQGWKDSHDSVFHADGKFPIGPISLIEVQGYASTAFSTMARLARELGEHDRTADYERRAHHIREKVEAKYWMPDMEFYGIALDGKSELCRVLSSNAGHLLAFDLVERKRGEAVARQLESALFHTGWGIRTLAAGQPRFNPMSYHNGSVWPHDTALCARGLARYGERSAAAAFFLAAFARELARQQAARERAPDHQADVFALEQRHEFAFQIAPGDRVIHLQRLETREAEPLRNAERLHDLPGGPVRHADIANVAGAARAYRARAAFPRSASPDRSRGSGTDRRDPVAGA